MNNRAGIAARLSTPRLGWLAMLCVFGALGLAALACTAGVNQYRGFNLGNVAQYECPTPTPVNTATPTYPTYVKAYPSYTSINTSNIWFFFDSVTILAQNAGAVYVTVNYYNLLNGTLVSLVSNQYVGTTSGYPGQSVYTLYSNFLAFTNEFGYFVMSVTSSSGAGDNFFVIVGPTLGTYTGPPPCYQCVPYIVYPTAVPTAVPYIRSNDFFLNDWVVIKYDPAEPNPTYAANGDAMKVGIRVMWDDAGTDVPQLPDGIPAVQRDPVTHAPQWVYVWKIEVYNTGVYQYDFFPSLQTYISDFIPAGSDAASVPPPPITGPSVWGPSTYALAEVMPSHYSDTFGPQLEPNNNSNGYVVGGQLTPSYFRSRELGTCGCPNNIVTGWPFCARWTTWPPYQCASFDVDGDVGLAPYPALAQTLGATARGPYGFIRDRIVMAAYGPPNLKIYRVGFALDMTKRPTPNGSMGDTGSAPTSVPGDHIASWINTQNPYPACRRDDVQP